MKTSLAVVTIVLVVSVMCFFATNTARGDELPCWEEEGTCCEEPIAQAELSALTIVSGDKAVVFIYDSIKYQDQFLRNDIAVLEEQTDIRDIEIWVNSFGGVTHTGFAIADIINAAEQRGFRIKGVAGGMVASIAIPVFLACDTRVAGTSTSFMVHEVRGAMEGTRSDFKASNQLVDLLTNTYIDVLVKETKIKDRQQWEDWINDTDWFNAQTALERGLIQKIE